MNDRLAAPEVERAVLAAVLASPELMPVLALRLTPHHFAARAHKLAWLALLGLVADGEPVSLLPLEARLERSGHLAEVGGRQRLLDLDLDLPATDDRSVASYLATLDDRLVRRQCVELSRRLRQEAVSYDGDARELPARLAKALETIDTRCNGAQSPDLGSTLASVWPVTDRGPAGLPGLRTGFPRWDELTGGLVRGGLWMLAGRTGRGKTSLGLQVALPQARAGVRVGVRSLEMTAEELALRILAQEGRVDSRDLRYGRLTLHQRRQLDGVAEGLKGLPLYLEESGPRTAAGVCAWARRMKLGLVLVDHLDLLEGANEPATIPEAASSLKALAKDLPGAVIALRQMNRYGARVQDAKVQDEDLRYGGENDCDVVSFLVHKDDHVDLMVTKNRYGPTGAVRLSWRPELLRFEEAA